MKFGACGNVVDPGKAENEYYLQNRLRYGQERARTSPVKFVATALHLTNALSGFVFLSPVSAERLQSDWILRPHLGLELERDTFFFSNSDMRFSMFFPCSRRLLQRNYNSDVQARSDFQDEIGIGVSFLRGQAAHQGI